MVRRERSCYMLRQTLATREQRADCLSIVIDGADQRCYGLPYFHQRTHGTEKIPKIATHVMGVHVHGRATYGLVYQDNIKQGTNVTIDALHHALQETLRRDGALPPKLFLQLDNTAKSCKSKYMLGMYLLFSNPLLETTARPPTRLGWLACLVQWGVFKEIQLSFLPVGHTHCDIDQFFSR